MAGLLLGGLLAGPVGAHPVDEIVQGAYLALAPGEVRLELDLTPGTEVAEAFLTSIDVNGDQRISEPEGRAFALRVLQQSTLMLDGKLATWRLDRVSAPAYQGLRQEGDTLKIYAIARRPDRAGARTLAYENRYNPAKSQCIANIFLQPGAGWRFQVGGQKHSQDGRGLSVSYAAARP